MVAPVMQHGCVKTWELWELPHEQDSQGWNHLYPECAWWGSLPRQVKRRSPERSPWHPSGHHVSQKAAGLTSSFSLRVIAFALLPLKLVVQFQGYFFFINFHFFTLCVWMFTCIFVCILPVCCAHRGQKRASHPPELGLQVVVSYHTCTGTKLCPL